MNGYILQEEWVQSTRYGYEYSCMKTSLQDDILQDDSLQDDILQDENLQGEWVQDTDMNAVCKKVVYKAQVHMQVARVRITVL